MSEMLKVEGLAKSYGSFSLDHIDLSVEQGCVTGLIGSNGAGKTTAIKAILGLIRPDEGRIVLFGEQLGSFGAWNENLKGRIGVVFDTCPFPQDCPVFDVGLIGSVAYPNWDERRFSELASLFGLEAKKKVKALSRGMGMKLQLAFALSHAPDLLVLDEVTAGLDPLAREEVIGILREFMDDGMRGILMSSHITSDLEKIADYVVCVDGGRKVFDKSVDEICDIAGVARCRIAEADELVESGVFPSGELRVIRQGYSVDVLVPDRAAMLGAFPDISCERVTIEEYMKLMLKGDVR